MEDFLCAYCNEAFSTADGRRKHIMYAHTSISKNQKKMLRLSQRQPTAEHLAEVGAESGEEALLLHQSTSATERQRHRERQEQQLCSTVAGPSSSSTTEQTQLATDLQIAELDMLVAWDEKLSRTQLNAVKAGTTELNERRADAPSRWLEEKLRLQGVTEHSTLEEITAEVHRQLTPWQGLATEGAEKAQRMKHYPSVIPQKRMLRNRLGRSSHASKGADGKFVYDMPVEQRVQQDFIQQPHSYSRCKTFLKDMQQKQASAVVNDDWIVDDYYTALNGLRHPHLGKSDSYFGVPLPCMP